MNEVPDTRDSLLIRVADPKDRIAWEQFAKVYHPVIYRVARVRGLQDADALDVAQQVLISVAQAIPQWERQGKNSRFRHWLCRIARNAAINMLTRQPKDRAVGGDVAGLDLHNLRPGNSELDSQIDREYRRQNFRKAAEIVRSRADESSWLAFSLTTIDGLSTNDAARQLNCSEAVVYAARSRIMRRLRNAVKELEDE